jgi:hypothetical protein
MRLIDEYYNDYILHDHCDHLLHISNHLALTIRFDRPRIRHSMGSIRPEARIDENDIKTNSYRKLRYRQTRKITPIPYDRVRHYLTLYSLEKIQRLRDIQQESTQCISYFRNHSMCPICDSICTFSLR